MLIFVCACQKLCDSCVNVNQSDCYQGADVEFSLWFYQLLAHPFVISMNRD